MRILVLTQDYPNEENPYAMSYVHTRNLNYIKFGHDVVNVSFSAESSYSHEGVRVVTGENFKDEACKADLIVSHAPNFKNHFKNLLGVRGGRIVLFFHGHEVLRTYGDYPTPYSWQDEQWLKKLLKKFYDELKIAFFPFVLKLLSRRNSLGAIFVSDWMKGVFEKNIGKKSTLQFSSLDVIPNAVNEVFLKSQYSKSKNKKADFVTIRPLDGRKYAADIVVDMAKSNPQYLFHVYGKGRLFDYIDKPENIVWFDFFVPQSDIPDLLDHYSVALMPTRYDAQGVMKCEMAAYGIPVVTSDIPIAREVLSGYDSSYFIDNDDVINSFSGVLEEFDIFRLSSSSCIREKFDSEMLARKEIDYFVKFVKK